VNIDAQNYQLFRPRPLQGDVIGGGASTDDGLQNPSRSCRSNSHLWLRLRPFCGDLPHRWGSGNLLPPQAVRLGSANRIYGLAPGKIGNFGTIQPPRIVLARAKGPLMQVVLAILIPLAVLAACSQGGDVTGATNQCKAALPYDEKNFEQCIAACIKCENGVTTTCATSCRLKGAK
jgi:hypothetical protein